MMDIDVDLHQWYTHSLIKRTSGSGIQNLNISNKELATDYTNQLLENLIKEKYIRLLLANFVAQI